MEVTKTNYKQILPHVEEAIKNCSFLAIDCELTGLNVVSESVAFDAPKQYYEKVLKNCKEFLVIQYGISTFRFDSNDGKFKHQSYNFYVFRRPDKNNIPDQRFLCQSSCIDFLISQGFDFNKLFKSGISYLNLSEENHYRTKIEEKRKLYNNQSSRNTADVIPIPEESQAFIDDILTKIDNFLNSDDDEIELPKCNAFLRRLIYQTVGQKHSNKISLQTKLLQNKDRILVVTKLKSKEEQEEIAKKQYDEEISILDDCVGFTKVLRMIVDSGKLVIGHNMFLDFVHTIDKFLTPLSPEYEEFKECANSLFRSVLDTKFMASSEEFKNVIPSTVLAELLDAVSKDPFQMCPVEIETNGQSYSVDDLKEHEAGYDAYITGLSLISMWNYLGKSQELPFKDFSLLKPYINKLYMMASRDIHVNLAGPDPNPPRDHVFFLTFPKEWKLNNIIQLFSPFGSVFVSWISDTSAYVALYKKEEAAVALSTLSQSDVYSIKTYKSRQLELNSVNSAIGNNSRRKRTSDYSSQQIRKKFKADKEELNESDDLTNSVAEKIESESESIKTPKKNRPKAFKEDSAWE